MKNRTIDQHAMEFMDVMDYGSVNHCIHFIQHEEERNQNNLCLHPLDNSETMVWFRNINEKDLRLRESLLERLWIRRNTMNGFKPEVRYV